MEPKIFKLTEQSELFRSHLKNIIDMEHQIVLLSQCMDWQAAHLRFGKHFFASIFGTVFAAKSA